jgi:translation initiation factor IF-3
LNNPGFRGRSGQPYRQAQEEKYAHRINKEIQNQQIRLVGENVDAGIYSFEEALDMAHSRELDLVEISDQGNVSICRIIDYSKFLYDQKKKQKEMKAKSAKAEMKEIRFGPNTNEHDYEFKLKHARRFLEEGSKVKAYVHFKGRTIMHSDRGQVLLLKFAQELEDVGKPDSLPKLEGKRMILMLSPKGKSK